MNADKWGERRLSEKAARRRRRKGLLVAAALVATVAIPFVAGVVDRWTGRRVETGPGSTASIIMALGFIGIAAYSARANWREIDEVQRSRALHAWAAMGMAGLALRPALRALQPVLHLSDPGGIAWLGALAVGGATLLYQRVRG